MGNARSQTNRTVGFSHLIMPRRQEDCLQSAIVRPQLTRMGYDFYSGLPPSYAPRDVHDPTCSRPGWTVRYHVETLTPPGYILPKPCSEPEFFTPPGESRHHTRRPTAADGPFQRHLVSLRSTLSPHPKPFWPMLPGAAVPEAYSRSARTPRDSHA